MTIFKKVTKEEALDDFISNASDNKAIKNNKKEKSAVAITLSITHKEKLKQLAKGISTIKEFIQNGLILDNEFFDDKMIMKIFYQATWENISIKDFIKKRLKFINYAPPAQKEEKITQIYLLDKEPKQEIDKRAKSIDKSINFYCSTKLAVLIEMQNLLNEDELQIIISEAKNKNKSVQEYLTEFF